ncbi:stage II sporulation protein M [Natronoflexus pectinivorans]|uniref:Putative membrane protein SpoIIM required for sporulation n=1 Tax=Natronoflexus pectinivorans TaxID=682526 RepID=A0A4R2GPY7_9BACT|nr:stage II sporulation protein M [Natronoflexus pectinivorans]TCO10769.1 putative membrane protein SpoIIM required for sporulation [Natronoflexus pectinivorans]
MKEISFISLNKARWSNFEKQLDSPGSISPDDLADQYILLTNDLSYARTFYPESGIVDYLNGLSAKSHSLIYRNKKEKSSRLLSFWIKELPIALYEARKDFLWSLIIFSISIVIGVAGAIADSHLIRLILGDAYVNMTLDNIAKGDPLGVYGKMTPFLMFLSITFNNVYVSFVAFLFGVLTPLGTAYVLFRNGVMVGSFITFFFQQSLGTVASITIMIHGTLELSAIVLAGGAGILLGKSILFPGTYTRKDSFLKGVRRGTKIMLGLVPFFVIAAWVESYITRHYNTMSTLSAILIIALSLGIILWYFIIVPYYVYRKTNSNEKHRNPN